MENGYQIKDETIIINRELTELDIFLKDFLDILKNHSDYLVVSEFVSISTGRIRGTEDIDVLVPIMKKEKFIKFFKDIEDNGFWCYQGDDVNKIQSYLDESINIRFARKN